MKKNRVKKIIICLLLIAILAVLGNFVYIKYKEQKYLMTGRSDTALELLQVVSKSAFPRRGLDSDVYIMTIDVSEFASFPISDFKEWAEKTYGSDTCFVMVVDDNKMPFENDSDVREFLVEQGFDPDVTCDWTHAYITRRSEKPNLTGKEDIEVRFNYMTIHEGEGWELNMKYKDDKWVIENEGPTFMS